MLCPLRCPPGQTRAPAAFAVGRPKVLPVSPSPDVLPTAADHPPGSTPVGFAGESAEVTGERPGLRHHRLRHRSPPASGTDSVRSSRRGRVPSPPRTEEGRNGSHPYVPVGGTGSARLGDREDRRARSRSGSGKPVRRSGRARTPIVRLLRSASSSRGDGPSQAASLWRSEMSFGGPGASPGQRFS